MDRGSPSSPAALALRRERSPSHLPSRTLASRADPGASFQRHPIVRPEHSSPALGREGDRRLAVPAQDCWAGEALVGDGRNWRACVPAPDLRSVRRPSSTTWPARTSVASISSSASQIIRESEAVSDARKPRRPVGTGLFVAVVDRAWPPRLARNNTARIAPVTAIRRQCDRIGRRQLLQHRRRPGPRRPGQHHGPRRRPQHDLPTLAV
jgi:hypothetical protein